MGDLGSIPGPGRSPGGGPGNPLQYSCLENPQGPRSLEDYSPWDRRVLQDLATKHIATESKSIPARGRVRRAQRRLAGSGGTLAGNEGERLLMSPGFWRG